MIAVWEEGAARRAAPSSQTVITPRYPLSGAPGAKPPVGDQADVGYVGPAGFRHRYRVDGSVSVVAVAGLPVGEDVGHSVAPAPANGVFPGQIVRLGATENVEVRSPANSRPHLVTSAPAAAAVSVSARTCEKESPGSNTHRLPFSPIIDTKSCPDDTPAQTAYRCWGWTKLGELQPFPDAPVFDAMILDLCK